MYYDLHLRFPDQATATDAVFNRVDGYDVPKYAAVDVVGTIYVKTGNVLTAADGMSYPETTPLSGWHVNVRHTEPMPELAAWEIAVDHPVRVWA